MSIQNRLTDLHESLAYLTENCYHYFAPSNATVPYIVWYEEMEDNSLNANNLKVRQGINGYVEYFTPTEFDSVFDDIQDTLTEVEGLSWTWESTQYGDPQNDDDNLIHHTWSWRLR